VRITNGPEEGESTPPTPIRPDSVRFQKDFQNCMSRFWVMRSNSAPRSSGSMTYFPDVRRDRAARPGGGGDGVERETTCS